MRKVVALSGGVVSTFFLFVFMASLISTKHIGDPGQLRTLSPESFFPSHFDEKPVPPKLQLPKREPAKLLPDVPTQGILNVDAPSRPNAPVVPIGGKAMTTETTWHPPTIGTQEKNIVDNNEAIGASASATPVAQMPPMYPRELAQQGIEGWVKLRFVVNEQGEPIDIVVVDANPKTMFNRAAIASIAKWRYRPAMIDGKTVQSTTQEIVLDFKLEN